MSAGDPDFRRWWSEHDVYQPEYGSKRYHHPLAGDRTLGFEALHPHGRPRPDTRPLHRRTRIAIRERPAHAHRPDRPDLRPHSHGQDPGRCGPGRGRGLRPPAAGRARQEGGTRGR
ncbi:hypothetical protein ACFVT6_38685 [Streptomyces sp. NPDC058049]|uniref:MmyB family transcriptional regulator n=1 Tax=Streptomyces sp. NPDC058049 TaxID=3346314 RepID=UPI0036DFC878